MHKEMDDFPFDLGPSLKSIDFIREIELSSF
jgi:hypothetical protein